MESTRLRAKGSMPHITSQWQPQEHGSYDSRLSSSRKKKSTEYLRPIAIPPSRPSHQQPSVVHASPMSFLGGPDDLWDFGSIRHIRQSSQDTNTPTSGVDSVFELPSGSFDSPYSSGHSSFVAELEDTSPMALKPISSFPPTPVKRPSLPKSTMKFSTTQMTSRAVIKVVDETIAAIEATNRQLLTRALAAESAAKILREQNSQLELKMRHCTDNHHRPKTAPSQPTHRTRPRHKPTPSSSQLKIVTKIDHQDPTPLSTFNDRIDKLVLPLPPKPVSKSREPPVFKPLQTRNQPPKTPLAVSPYTDMTPHPHLSGLSPTPKHHSHHHRPPISAVTPNLSPPLPLPLPLPSAHPSPQIQTQTQPQTRIQKHGHCPLHPAPKVTLPLPPLPPTSVSVLSPPISSPIPGSVARHEGTPLSASSDVGMGMGMGAGRGNVNTNSNLVSLEEARRRAKPLPPLGPMSPSIVRGLVEIGTPRGVDHWGRAVRFDDDVQTFDSSTVGRRGLGRTGMGKGEGEGKGLGLGLGLGLEGLFEKTRKWGLKGRKSDKRDFWVV